MLSAPRCDSVVLSWVRAEWSAQTHRDEEQRKKETVCKHTQKIYTGWEVVSHTHSKMYIYRYVETHFLAWKYIHSLEERLWIYRVCAWKYIHNLARKTVDIHFTHTLRHTFKTVDILSRKTVDILSRTNSDVDSRTHTINTSAQTKHTRDFQTKPTRDFPDTIRLEYIMSDTGWRSVIGCLIIIGLFCKRALQNRRYSAKETYYLIDPTYE